MGAFIEIRAHARAYPVVFLMQQTRLQEVL